MKKSIAFIGTGKMATALISSIYKNRLAKEVIATNKNKENLKTLKKQFKTLKNRRFLGHRKSKGFSSVKTTTDNKEAVRKSDIVFICVKPQDIDAVLNEIKNIVKNQLLVSIAAGIKTKHIEKILKSDRSIASGELKNKKFLSNKKVIRVMPNINCLVGEMAAGFSSGKYATKEDVKYIAKILNTAGMSFYIKEELIDALSVVSGAGPAFFAYFIEAIAEAGIKKGLQKEMAYKLAAKTALGTGKLMLEKNLTPEEIISMVASKKGVALAGLEILNKNKVKNILEKMVDAAYKRSKELGK